MTMLYSDKFIVSVQHIILFYQRAALGPALLSDSLRALSDLQQVLHNIPLFNTLLRITVKQKIKFRI